MTTQNPTDLARETLKQLASRQLLPTPENFAQIYAQVSGNGVARKHRLTELLTQAFASLSPQGHSYRLGLTRLNQALDSEAWEQVPQLCIDLITLHVRERELADNWGNLILSLLRVWEVRHPELTQAYKQSALERLIINFGKNPEELNQKLHKLLHDWSRGQHSAVTAEQAEPLAAIPSSALPADNSDAGWSSAIMLTLKYGVEPRLIHYPALLDSYQALQQQLEDLENSEAARLDFTAKLRTFLLTLELQKQQDERLVSGLSNLLTLLLQNIAELNGSDSYLLGQIS
ncbi:MAG: GGDEF domain-containing protein, partial [Craterilacuibacter sp.]